tara:strand:- start:1835 stop:2035 length:201 start_codon:yes stop_codon:yes gene_type:complete
MEIKSGSLAIATLAITFIGLQIWWITLTLSNLKKDKKNVTDLLSEKGMENNALKDKKEKLEKLFKK